jgi:lipopolysaccharide/colanic/teichoic acid biosynthesis glycosyltransferase
LTILDLPLSSDIAPPVRQARNGELTSYQIPLQIRFVKRVIDIVVAAVALLIVAPFIPLLMLAIWLDSPGPIFYRQRRACGMRRMSGGQFEFLEFDMFKFRTMRVDAEKCTGAVLASESDPRVTRVGRCLRKTRLDELPQLWNVMVGTMSVVGPRPERPELFRNLALAIPFFEERTRGAKPGITGLAQISLGYSGRAPRGTPIAEAEPFLLNPYKLEGTDGSEADDMRTKLLFDLAYLASLEHMGSYLRTEVAILLKTPWVMLRGLGR